jgi:hypothetical protein
MYVHMGKCLGHYEIVAAFEPLIEPLKKKYAETLLDLQSILDELDLKKPISHRRRS